MTTGAIRAVAIVPEKHSWEDAHRGATPGEDGAWSLAASLSSLLPSKNFLSSARTGVQHVVQDASLLARGDPGFCSVPPLGARGGGWHGWGGKLGRRCLGHPGIVLRVHPCLPSLLLALRSHSEGWLSDVSLLLLPPASSSSTRSSMCTAWKIWSSSSPWSTCRSQTACYSECPWAMGTPPATSIPIAPGLLASQPPLLSPTKLPGNQTWVGKQKRRKYSETSSCEITEHSGPGYLVQAGGQ